LAPTTLATTFDGPVDRGLEQQAEAVVRAAHQRRADGPDTPPRAPAGGGMEDVSTEAAAHALLRLVADQPGLMGRLRAARIIGGYPVPHRDDAEATTLGRYAIQLDWPLREIVRLVDALLSGGLIAQTSGPRPVLVLTRAGYAALGVLEGGV
ncbi:MAG: hypothetical protein JWM90_277, partial [Thermoleophilia bacterium]|nr:hypothetical protein [Thermoleophilia bacterium]